MREKWQRFFKIEKIDKEERMVYGYATTPDLDSDGEIIKIEAIEKSLPDYLKFPTIREMHQPKAIGTTKEAEVRKKGLWIGAKIVDKAAWELVKEGVYKAFSIGGDVLKRAGNIIQELDLIEISLVDVPANKHATIEVWKRGKVSKNAETTYSLANLMIQVKDAVSYYEYLGKDSKKLKKALELIKQMLVVEASEPENEGSKDGGIFTTETPDEITQKIAVLEAIDFTKNQFADLIRKGVIMSMNKKANELKKQDDPKDSEDPKETPTDDENPKDETETTEANPEDKGELETALQKIQEIDKVLEKLTPSKEEVKHSQDLVKAVGSMAGTLAKMAETLAMYEGRIAKLEETPAALKSKSAVVLKALKTDDKSDNEDESSKSNNPRLEVVKTRLQELNKIHDSIGKNAFAKQGFTLEAIKLQDELSRLESVAQA